MNTLNLLKYTATLGPVGYIPVAPGTAGTAAGFLFLLITRPSGPLLIFVLLLSAVVGTISSHFAEISFGGRDPQKVVIDEFSGFLVSMSFVDITPLMLSLAFIFFRIFDILKPPPIRTFETYFKGGLGVMADDIMAGIYANIALHLCNYLIRMF